jgi:hypothetical protein
MKTSDLKAKAARHLKIVEWSEEDGTFVGTCPGLMFGGIHGEDEEKVYAELCYCARELNPEYRGILDLLCWKIGRNWCRPMNPACNECYLNELCPKSI